MAVRNVPLGATDMMCRFRINQIVIILMIAALFIILGWVIDFIGLILLTRPILCRC